MRIASLNLLILWISLFLVAPSLAVAQTQHDDRIGAGDGVTRIETRFGMITVVSKADIDGDDAYRTLVILGPKTLKLYGYGAEIESHFVLSNEDLLVITTAGGVRGVPNDYYLIRVDRSGLKDLSEGTDFGTADYTFNSKQNGDTISFDLGFENRRRKSAIYRNGELQVLVTQVAGRPQLSKNDCAFVLNAIAECKAAADCSEPASSFSMMYVRGLATLENNPGFSRTTFDGQCRAVCRTGNYSAAPVRRKLCNY